MLRYHVFTKRVGASHWTLHCGEAELGDVVMVVEYNIYAVCSLLGVGKVEFWCAFTSSSFSLRAMIDRPGFGT